MKVCFFFLLKKSFLRKNESEGLNKNEKKFFLTAFVRVIKKGPTTSIRKRTKELNEKNWG